MLLRPSARLPKPRIGLGLPEVQAQAALAYEQTSWRSGIVSPRSATRQLLEEALARGSRDKASAPAPAYQARSAGRSSMPMQSPKGEHRSLGRSRWRAKSADPAVLAANISHLFKLFLGPGKHRGAASQRDRDGCRGPGRLVTRRSKTRRTSGGWSLYLELGRSGWRRGRYRGEDPDRSSHSPAYSFHPIAWLSHHAGAYARRVCRCRARDPEIPSAPPVAVHADQLSMQIFTLRRDQGRLAAFQPIVSAFSTAAVRRKRLAAGIGADLSRNGPT